MSLLDKPIRKKRIVVLGAGFAGLTFCRRFRSEFAEIILIDRQNHHLFQPLLYQVATAGLSMPEISRPIRSILSRRKNVTVLMDEVTGIDAENKHVILKAQKEPLAFDYLVIGLGAQNDYFGHPEWEAHAPGLKSLDDAIRIRQNLLLAFEQAEITEDPETQRRLLTIAVIGGGPTGVELAGACAELARVILRRDFRRIDPEKTKIILIEAGERILSAFDPELSAEAEKQLRRLGVNILKNEPVQSISKEQVVLKDLTIQAGTILWGAGVRGNPLAAKLGIELDSKGRIPVRADCSLNQHRNIFAVGDIATLKDGLGQPVPTVSPAAMQMANHVARIIRDEIECRTQITHNRPSFVYNNKGSMATIGRAAAIAQMGRLKLKGYSAWLAWLFVHLIFLVGFRNKAFVLLQWAWSYFTYGSGSRVISGMDRTFRIKPFAVNPASRVDELAQMENQNTGSGI